MKKYSVMLIVILIAVPLLSEATEITLKIDKVKLIETRTPLSNAILFPVLGLSVHGGTSNTGTGFLLPISEGQELTIPDLLGWAVSATINNTGLNVVDVTIGLRDLVAAQLEIKTLIDINPSTCCRDFSGTFDLFSSPRLGFTAGNAPGDRAEVSFSIVSTLDPPIVSATNVVSDSTWKSSNIAFAGWEQLYFNDSTWVNARAPYPASPSPSSVIPDTSAQYIWYDPNKTSDGTTGPDEVFLRKTFALVNGTHAGIAQIAADDDYEFFVNGQRLILNENGGLDMKANGTPLPQSVDISRYLLDGINVFAIHAVDGGFVDNGTPNPHGYDRLNEWALFDAKLSTTIPEPSITLLLVAGLIIFLSYSSAAGNGNRLRTSPELRSRRRRISKINGKINTEIRDAIN